MRIPAERNVVRFTRGQAILRYVDPVDGFHIVSVHAIEPIGIGDDSGMRPLVGRPP